MPRSSIPVTAARAVVLLAAALLAGGCAGPPPGRDRAPEALARGEPTTAADPETSLCDPCPGTPAPGDTLSVGLPADCDPGHAPEPINEAERTVFRNLYETLLTVACDGSAHPGLAESWSAADDGRRWTFTLRADARFWDGRPVTSHAVQAAWTATQHRAQAAGCLLPWAWLDAEAASIHLLDARRLSIQLPEPQADFPLLLAHPAYAVALPVPGEAWALGSGPCRPLAGRGPLTCVPNPLHPDGRPAWRRLIFVAPHAAWPGPGVDVALRAGEELRAGGVEAVPATPLPWNRIVLFLCPAGGAERTRWTGDPGRGEALPDAAPATSLVFPGIWGESCPQLSGPAAGRGTVARIDSAGAVPSGRLLYPRADPVAGELARRMAERGGGRAVGVDAAEWPGALRDGRAGGYVLSVTRCFATPCLQLAALLGSATWLQNAALGGGGAPGEAARHLLATGVVTPLVKTRSSLVLRPGVVGLRVTPDGALLLAGAGRAGPP